MTTSPTSDAPLVLQPSLIPGERPTFWPEELPLWALNDIEVGGVQSSPGWSSFVESVRTWGVIVPIILTHHDGRDHCDGIEHGYQLVAGRRRLAAARAAELPRIRAIVGTSLAELGPVLALIENSHRHANPLVELERIQALQARGASESQIARATGMTQQTIRRRLRLAGLIPLLMMAFKDGAFPASVAEAAARLPHTSQEGLVATVAETGRLTMADVESVRRVHAAGHAAQIRMDVFDTPDAGDFATVRALLQQAKAALPDVPAMTGMGIHFDALIERVDDAEAVTNG